MDRRTFLLNTGAMAFSLAGGGLQASPGNPGADDAGVEPGTITLFLGGDVMTARGIDQILPGTVDPLTDQARAVEATKYIELAEARSGAIPRHVDFDYVWGDALGILDEEKPDFRIVNLETSITTGKQRWPGKGIAYRMNPANVPVLSAAGIQCCALANNHVLDYSSAGMIETIEVLKQAGISSVGAGQNVKEAGADVAFEMPGGGSLRVYACADSFCGAPMDWAAQSDRPGINHVGWLDPLTTRELEEKIRSEKQAGDVVVVSVHWGGNWGYEVPRDRRTFARRLVRAGADVVHGHSSHHPMGIEVFEEKPIIYGAGDLINDYEGISREARFRGELTFMYFVTLDRSSGRLVGLRTYPMRIHKFRLQHASDSESLWLREMLEREGASLGTGVVITDSALDLQWSG